MPSDEYGQYSKMISTYNLQKCKRNIYDQVNYCIIIISLVKLMLRVYIPHVAGAHDFNLICIGL